MFITLHDYSDGTPFMVNVSHLVLYDDHTIYTEGAGIYKVKETMQEIAVNIALAHC